MKMLEEGDKTQEEITRDLDIPKSTFYLWKKKINFLKSEDGQAIVDQARKRPIYVKPLIVSDRPELNDILVFEDIPVIRDYKNNCRLNKSPDYTPNIFKICNLTQKSPDEFSASLENAKSIYLDFESKWDEMFTNVTTENYRKGARSFL